jgi:hypothetical protein
MDLTTDKGAFSSFQNVGYCGWETSMSHMESGGGFARKVPCFCGFRTEHGVHSYIVLSIRTQPKKDSFVDNCARARREANSALFRLWSADFPAVLAMDGLGDLAFIVFDELDLGGDDAPLELRLRDREDGVLRLPGELPK